MYSGERGRVLAASFYIEFIIETFFTEIAPFVGHPIVEPAMRLDDKFCHRSYLLSLDANSALDSFANAAITLTEKSKRLLERSSLLDASD